MIEIQRVIEERVRFLVDGEILVETTYDEIGGEGLRVAIKTFKLLALKLGHDVIETEVSE